ncbi:TRAP transporter small permease [Halomonas sp. HMF6819]|uniref:TRAP transporter small permease n=1 Tax=Halomonas sp. HMF6819 TaxID=3373085 RepID=UPI00378F3DC2
MATLQEHKTMTDPVEHYGLIGGLDTICRWLENTLIFVAGSMINCAMIITFIDVVMRYVFNSPLNWFFDLITMYLLPGSYFLAFSYALRTGNHLKVDYFKSKLPPSVTRFCLLLFGFVAFMIFSYITYAYSLRAYSAWHEKEMVYGVVNWIVWPSDFIIAISSLVFSLRLLITAVFNYLVKGSEL